jgi:hypothetical protein
MRAIAGANASHGLSDDVFGFFLRNGLPSGVHLSKIPPQLVRYFQFPLMRDGDRLKRTDAYRFVFLNTAPRSASMAAFWSGERSLALQIMR